MADNNDEQKDLEQRKRELQERVSFLAHAAYDENQKRAAVFKEAEGKAKLEELFDRKDPLRLFNESNAAVATQATVADTLKIWNAADQFCAAVQSSEPLARTLDALQSGDPYAALAAIIRTYLAGVVAGRLVQTKTDSDDTYESGAMPETVELLSIDGNDHAVGAFEALCKLYASALAYNEILKEQIADNEAQNSTKKEFLN